MEIMEHFTGTIFFCTLHSVYRIRVTDPTSSPEIMKMATESSVRPDGGPIVNPVGGVLRKGFWVGVSRKSVVKYGIAGSDRIILGSQTIQTGSATGKPIAFFRRRAEVDECFRLCQEKGAKVIAYDPQWRSETIQTLRLIGIDHPTVIIATVGDRWSIPSEILAKL